MSTFAYTALSKDGRKLTGTLSADNRSAAIAQMSRQGIHPIKIAESTEVAKKKSASIDSAAANIATLKVPAKSVESFTRELANLLAGGVPLSRSLALLKRESSNPGAKQLWTKIHDDVVGGKSLADSLAEAPRTFSTVYVAMVRAGESGGFLELVLGQISDFRTREADLKGKVKAALVYPCVLAVLMVGVLTFLLIFFVPRLTAMFKEAKGTLPALTVAIVAMSNALTRYWYYIVGVVIFAVIAFKRAINTNAGKRRMERITLGTPFIGQIVSHFALVRFCRMLGTLLSSGVPLVSSLRTAREAIGIQTLADTVTHAIEQVQRGEALSRALAESPKLFPPSVIEMIAVAEETGRMDKELVRLATSYESDLDRQLKMIVTIAEPLMLVIMASLVGTIIVGMMLPIFNLQEIMK